jgi:hypothetical protein
MVMKATRRHFVLVDCASMPLTELALLKDSACELRLLVGPGHAPMSAALASVLDDFGDRVECIRLAAGGRSAGDFALAFQLGFLSSLLPGAQFHVLSRDSGCDAFLKYLRQNGIIACRFAGVADIPRCGWREVDRAWEPIDLVLADLLQREVPRPRTRKALHERLQSLFGGTLGDAQRTALCEILCATGLLRVAGNRVSYALPA